MSDDLKEARDAPRATGRLLRAEHVRSDYVFILPPGTDWRESLRPQFWQHFFNRLEGGDRLEVHTADHQIQFELFILECNHAAEYLRLGAAPLFPPNLSLPAVLASSADRPRYGIVRTPGEASLFDVVDHHTALVVTRSVDRTTADGEVRARNMADREAHELAARDRAAFGNADETHAEPSVTAGALRTRRYREKQRASASAA